MKLLQNVYNPGFLQKITLILWAIIYNLDTIYLINTCTILSSASNQIHCQCQYENNKVWHEILLWTMEVYAWHTWIWCTQFCPQQLIVWLSVSSWLDILTLSFAALLQIMINNKAISNQIHCHYQFENNKVWHQNLQWTMKVYAWNTWISGYLVICGFPDWCFNTFFCSMIPNHD